MCYTRPAFGTIDLCRHDVLREFHQLSKRLNLTLHDFRTHHIPLHRAWEMGGYIVHHGSYSDVTLGATI